MLVSKRNEEYKKQCWTIVTLMGGCGMAFIILCVYLFVQQYTYRSVSDLVGMIIATGAINFICFHYVRRFYNEAVNEYIFENQSLIIRNTKKIKRKIPFDSSVKCVFLSQCKVFHGMYSDAIAFIINGNELKPIIIYKDFNDEFYSVRDWLLENGIKIEAFTDPSNKYCLGEKDPSYQYFLKAESMKKKMPSSKVKHNEVESKATIKTNKNWVFKRGFISTITIFGLIYCQYIFPINSLGQLMEKIMVALIVIALSGLAPYGLGALLSIELTVVDDKLKIKKVGRVKEYNLQKDITNIEYKESVKDHSGNYGNQLNFCIGNKIYKFNSTEYPDLDEFVSVLRENTDVIDY